MKKSTISITLCAMVAIACNNSVNKESTSAIPVERDTMAESIAIAPAAVSDTSISGCYTAIVKRDTSTLQLDVKNGNATGPLSINIYQKDRNDGTFQGDISNGMIKGWYLFKSEGTMYVRQAIFKIKDRLLIPAVGEMVEKNDSSFFTNPEKVKFDEARALAKVKCVI